MILAGAALTCSSLTVRLVMGDPSLSIGYRFIRREPGFRYCPDAIGTMHWVYRGHKKASRDLPPARRLPILPGPGTEARRYDAGISTVSTTWITPFDWLTFEIVTIEVPPLASMIQTLLPSCFTVSSSPSAVLSFMPSFRSDAASLPGTTW